MKIVVTYANDLSSQDKARLDSFGDVTYFESLTKSREDYLDRVNGADIILSDGASLKLAYGDLKDVFISVNFVSVAFLDLQLMAKNGVTIANAPGANKHAVAEWIIYMLLEISRKFTEYLNRTNQDYPDGALPPINESLADKNITVLGKGSVGTQVGKVLESMDVNVTYITRGADLYESVSNSDFVVNTLSSNDSTLGLLDTKFFESVKKGTAFISVARGETMDENALIAALDSGNLSIAATDCAHIFAGDVSHDYYQKMLKHPKVIATPHIAYNARKSLTLGNQIMIDNVEAWIKGKPQNLLN